MNDSTIKKNKLNLGILTFPASGPNNIQLLNLVELFVPLSKELHVITGNEAYINLKKDERINVYGVNHINSQNMLSRIFRYFLTQLKLSYHFFKVANKADTWVFMGGDTLLLPVITAFILRVEIFLLVVGHVDTEIKMKEDIGLSNSFILILFKKISLLLSSQIVLYSPILIERWGLLNYKNKILIAHEHFFDIEMENYKSFSERDQLVGYIGRLSEEKGIMNFVKSISYVLKKCDVKFLIGGNGPLSTELKDYVKNNDLEDYVIFTDWISHDDIYRYLEKLKILILPSYSEGLPNIMLEAMACGTPVLVTAVGAIPDLIKNEKNGFIMQNNDPLVISDNIIKALEYPEIESIIDNAFTLIKTQFNYNFVSHTWLTLFNR